MGEFIGFVLANYVLSGMDIYLKRTIQLVCFKRLKKKKAF